MNEVKDTAPEAPEVRRSPWILIGCAGLLVLPIAAVLAVLAADPYRRPPKPEGMALRIPFGEVRDPLGRVLVAPSPGGRAAFRVRNPFAQDGEPPAFEVDYPSGATRALSAEDPLPPAPFFDLDGDGVEDRLWIGTGPETSIVRILSGASGAVLVEDDDPFEYANPQRAFPLGDLDGDGYGELALVHPRESRTYDFHPGDRIFGVSSWVTVISGARLAR